MKTAVDRAEVIALSQITRLPDVDNPIAGQLDGTKPNSDPRENRIIPRLIDHNPWTQSRIPMEVMRDGQLGLKHQVQRLN